MATRSTHIRFDPVAYDFIAREAARTGVSFNDFVRGAALVRASLSFASNEPTDVAELLSQYAAADEAVRRLGDGLDERTGRR